MTHKNHDAQLAYQTTRIRTASREQLLLITYDIAIGYVISAEEAIKEKQSPEAINDSLVKAQRAIRELMVTLNPEAGGEVMNNLMALYDFMFRSLVEANVDKDLEKVETVRSMLEELRETWKQVIEKVKEEQREKTPVPAGSPKGGINLAG